VEMMEFGHQGAVTEDISQALYINREIWGYFMEFISEREIHCLKRKYIRTQHTKNNTRIYTSWHRL
jgi:DNA mismatch repair ATPase MutS